jgi:hypothetical protein
VSLWVQRRFLLVGVEPQALRTAHWRGLAARQNCRLSRSEKNRKFKIPLPGRQKNFSKISDSGVQKRSSRCLPPGRSFFKQANHTWSEVQGLCRPQKSKKFIGKGCKNAVFTGYPLGGF